MLFRALIFSLCVVYVASQNWQTNSYILESEQFFTNVMQETFNELENQEWCNLKAGNIYQTISDSLYNFLVNGTVTYHNGFLVSIQRINLLNIQGSLSATTAVVRGNVNLNDVTIGFDVDVNLNDNGVESVQRYTGTYNHLLIQFQVAIQKDLATDEISAFTSLMSLQAGSGVRMIYMPANNVTEALSRRWVPSNNWDGVTRWGSEHIVPIIRNLVPTRVAFPDICIGCYA